MSDRSGAEFGGNPRNFNDPGRPSLAPEDIGALGDALLNLTREVWVLTDRMMVLEAVLEQQGVSVAEAVDNFEPDEAMQQRLQERGSALVQNVLTPFTRD